MNIGPKEKDFIASEELFKLAGLLRKEAGGKVREGYGQAAARGGSIFPDLW